MYIFGEDICYRIHLWSKINKMLREDKIMKNCYSPKIDKDAFKCSWVKFVKNW